MEVVFPGAGPLIIAPNHPSLLDAVMILSRLPDLGCVMKAELMDNILFGSAARLARFIRNDSSHGMIKQSVRELGRGSHLLLFPEGTRTTHMPVNRFKGSVALIAKKSGVPVQTVIIETNSQFLGKDWPLCRRPTFPLRYRARLGRCFLPSGNVRAFSIELEHYFAEELKPSAVRHPNGLPSRPIADAYTECDESAFPDSPGPAAQL
jgi:1-acyl-sn-glycerol-3-phosphate acyltransferase